MVRLKSRYLLVHILYPTTPTSRAPPQAPNAKDPLPPLLEFHKPTPDAFTAGDLIKLIRDGVSALFGDYGAGMVGGSLAVKYLSPATSTFILRAGRAHYRLVWAALTAVTALPEPLGTPVVMRVVHVSGSMRLCEEEAVRRAKEVVRRAREGDQGFELGSLVSGGAGDTMREGGMDVDMMDAESDGSRAGEEEEWDGFGEESAESDGQG